jgi:uncharacterized protein YceH (UPF0502 family)
MEIQLTPIEVRILGALIEKEITTPQYYPITLNALTNACNQKSNRYPVMNLDDKTVVRILEELRFDHKLTWRVSEAGARVPKYKHNISVIHEFSPQEVSLLCELFLRGPQTLGELRSHTARLCEFENLEEVEEVLQNLINAEQGPFVQKLPREAGRRENRYAHLFCGEVKVDEDKLKPLLEPATIEVQAENKRIEALEENLSKMKEELAALKEQFDTFKKQFD